MEYVQHGYKHIEPADLIITLAWSERRELMDPEAMAIYKSLPKTVTVYRGCSKTELEDMTNGQNISWTLNPKVADFFAYRFTTEGRCVIKATIKKTDIRSIILERNEDEVLVIGIKDYEMVSDENNGKEYDYAYKK